jgi:hypothetical protein
MNMHVSNSSTSFMYNASPLSHQSSSPTLGGQGGGGGASGSTSPHFTSQQQQGGAQHQHQQQHPMGGSPMSMSNPLLDIQHMNDLIGIKLPSYEAKHYLHEAARHLQYIFGYRTRMCDEYTNTGTCSSSAPNNQNIITNLINSSEHGCMYCHSVVFTLIFFPHLYCIVRYAVFSV